MAPALNEPVAHETKIKSTTKNTITTTTTTKTTNSCLSVTGLLKKKLLAKIEQESSVAELIPFVDDQQQQQTLSNGPHNGPIVNHTHMDQSNNPTIHNTSIDLFNEQFNDPVITADDIIEQTKQFDYQHVDQQHQQQQQQLQETSVNELLEKPVDTEQYQQQQQQQQQQHQQQQQQQQQQPENEIKIEDSQRHTDQPSSIELEQSDQEFSSNVQEENQVMLQCLSEESVQQQIQQLDELQKEQVLHNHQEKEFLLHQSGISELHRDNDDELQNVETSDLLQDQQTNIQQEFERLLSSSADCSQSVTLSFDHLIRQHQSDQNLLNAAELTSSTPIFTSSYSSNNTNFINSINNNNYISDNYNCNISNNSNNDNTNSISNNNNNNNNNNDNSNLELHQKDHIDGSSNSCCNSNNNNDNGNNNYNNSTGITSTSEMDQMLGELTASTSDLDFLQVLKNFESVTPSDNLCELAGNLSIFNYVDSMGLEDVVGAANVNVSNVGGSSGSGSGGGNGDGNGSGNCITNIGFDTDITCTMPPIIKEFNANEVRIEIEKQQTQLVRKCENLLCRLRKLQARYMGKHINEEINGLFEHTQQHIKRKDREIRSITTMTSLVQYQNEKQKQLSASSMKNLLKRIDQVATNQQSSLPPVQFNTNSIGRPSSTQLSASLTIPQQQQQQQQQPSSLITSSSTSVVASMLSSNSSPAASTIIGGGGAGAGGGSHENSGNTKVKVNNSTSSFLIPPYDANTTNELANTAGLLHSELKIIQHAFDSDATESSSGGESADEMITYNNPTQLSLSIGKRAAWKWARERAAIASRWSWLLAQISDLEFKIRQQNELNRQIKKTKGLITFENPSTTTLATATIASLATTTAAAITTTATTTETTTTNSSSVLTTSVPTSMYSNSSLPLLEQIEHKHQSVNGYRGLLPGNSKPLFPNDDDSLNACSIGSCRTRPFQYATFRKRKLLQTTNLHTISKKAARSSTIKCGCQWPLHPCALCTGRQDPTAPRYLPDMMPLNERVALVDPSFHPVLSFMEDISHCVYFEGAMRQPEWQNKAFKCTSKAAIRGALAIQKAIEREDRSQKIIESRRKYTKKFNVVANKLKKARHSQNKKYSRMVNNKYNKNADPASSETDSATGLPFDSLEGKNSNGTLQNTKNASPIQSGYHKHEKYIYADRKNRNSYDIHNIVIPYSVAASTRVELLPYKEIPTPKWRLIDDDENESEMNNSKTNMCQDNGTDENADSKDLNSQTTIKIEPNKRITLTSETEDVSTEAIQVRHERALLDERKKFATFLKFPYSTRSRANRRIDSRGADSSGANTPDPMISTPNTPSIGGGDQESVPSSPAAPLTPNMQSDNVDTSETGGGGATNGNETQIIPPGKSKSERRRTVSLKKQIETKDDCQNATPDSKDVIPPFEQLQFPLSDELYESMVSLMPKTNSDDNKITTSLTSTVINTQTTLAAPTITTVPILTTHQFKSGNKKLINQQMSVISGEPRPVTALGLLTMPQYIEDPVYNVDSDTESIESYVADDEDPNDPEWFEPPSRL